MKSSLVVLSLALLLVAAPAAAQVAPFGGAITLGVSSSTPAPAVGTTFTVDLTVDLSAATGSCGNGGGSAPFTLGAASIGIAFDRSKLAFVSGGLCPSSPPEIGVTCTEIASGANCVVGNNGNSEKPSGGAFCLARLTLKNLSAAPGNGVAIKPVHDPAPRGVHSNSVQTPGVCGGPGRFPPTAITVKEATLFASE